MVLRLVNSSEQKKPPQVRTAATHTNDTPGMKVAQVATSAVLMSALTVESRRKPILRRTMGMMVFMPMAPTTLQIVMRPDWNAVMWNPSCSRSGSRNGIAPMPER